MVSTCTRKGGAIRGESMYKKTQHIHFVGVGGIGMSGIAELLLNLGYRVSGSDVSGSAITENLARLGGRIRKGHRVEWVGEADVVVASSAISPDNPEIMAARERGVPVIQRAEMLAEIMRLKKFGIAVAGSHGKTSTTSMVGWMLTQAGLEPTIVVGGKVDSLGGNARLGEGEFLVAEADESDGSFLKLSPVVEVVTNIDLEHVDYYRDIDHTKELFLEFMAKVPFYGAIILCLDDANIADISSRIERRMLSYGLTREADICGEGIRFADGKVHFLAVHQGETLGEIAVAPPGRHTVYNALATIGVGLELEIPFPVIARSLESFQGVQRRMQFKGEKAGITVVDDYGHHPTEIVATLSAIKEAWPEKRLVVLFQPHRYSRTKGLFAEFQDAFEYADFLVMTEIYAASEKPLEGVNGEALLQAVRFQKGQEKLFLGDLDRMAQELLPHLERGDMVLTLGAGNIVRVGEELLDLLGLP